MILKRIFPLLFLAVTLTASAQTTIEIKGAITDEQNVPIELAAIRVRQLPDSSIVKTGFSEADGRFLLRVETASPLLVDIQYLGYETFMADNLTKDTDLGTIRMMPQSKMLDGVTITAKTNYLERRVDRLVVNVDALIANAASNTLEALERAPGVSVDPNNGITLKGRSGVVIFVDDKPTYLAGADLENYLRSLPANTVKSIEIMTNPPAKYEAAGNAGVINIVTKRNTLKGLWGSVSLGYNQGVYGRSNNSLNLSFNRAKLSLFAQGSVNIHNSFQDLNINRYYQNPDLSPSSSFAQNSYIRKNGYSLNGRVGADYALNSKTTLGASVKGLTNPGVNLTDNTAFVRNASESLLNRVLADNEDKQSFENRTYNINFRRQIDTTGGKLTFDADYVEYRSDNTQVYQNFIFLPDNSLDFKDQLDGKLPSEINIYALKTDFSKTIFKKIGFEAGLKSAFTETDNEAVYNLTKDGITTPDYGLTNRFFYNEWINAGYTNFNGAWGKAQIQAGLRLEHTTLEGKQTGNPQVPASRFTRDYTSLFPTLFVQYPLDAKGENSVNASYGRRIERPYFQDLNPFISPLDKFTYYTGNPGLLPTFSHNIGLTYSWKSRINTSLNFSKTNNGVNETLEIVDGIYYSRPNNTAEATTLSLSVEGGVPLYKWWNVNFYTEAGRNTYKGPLYTEQLDAKGNYAFTQVNNSFKLGKGWNAEVSGIYQTDVVYAQLLIKSYGLLNAAFQKTILKSKGTIKLAFNDILYTRRADGIINYLRLTKADWNSDLDTRQVAVAFSYRFGKATTNKPRYNAAGSEDEQKRVKS